MKPLEALGLTLLALALALLIPAGGCARPSVVRLEITPAEPDNDVRPWMDSVYLQRCRR